MESPVGYRVFVGGISWKADEVQLEKFFSTHGQVLECKIIMDKATGKSKGYGFVTFKDATTAEFVKQTANFNFLGKNMNVGDAVRKAPEPNGANYNGPRPHGNYNNGFHQPYYNPNYYNRQADTQYYGQFSPDGSFYPAQFYFPQGYRGTPQYPYNYQSFPPSEGDSSLSSGDASSASPPSFGSSNYTPFTPNGNAPNFTPYYNNNTNNYYNAYYYPYAAAGGVYPATGYAYNQGFAPMEGGGGDEAGGAPSSSGDHVTPPHHHDAPHPSHDTTTPVYTTPSISTDTPSDASPLSHTALPPSTPTSAASDAIPPLSTTPPMTSYDVTTTLPKEDGITTTSGSPAQTRAQGGSTKPQQKQQPQQQPQQPQQNQAKQKRPKSPPPRSTNQDLHGHVIPNFSKLSVSSN